MLWAGGTGMTLGDGMGRDMEGGLWMGAHVCLWLIHVNVWQKPLQYCKVISLQLNNFFFFKKDKTNCVLLTHPLALIEWLMESGADCSVVGASHI